MDDAIEVLTAKVYRYCELFDTGQFEAFAEQFRHGRWFVAEPGRQGALDWINAHVLTYDGLPCTKHVTTNLIVDVADDGARADASSYVTVFQALPDFPLQPIVSARYRDRFEQVDGEWRWIERAVIVDLRGDASHHVRAAAE
jgi:hypothetical protein